jgi:hypothetical protein
MDLPTIYGICAIVATLTLVGVGVSVVRTLRKVQASIERLERLAEQVEPAIKELEGALRQVRVVTTQVSGGIDSVREFTSWLGQASGKAIGAGSLFLHGGAVGRVVAVAQALRAGARVFLRRAGGREEEVEARSGDGGPEA